MLVLTGARLREILDAQWSQLDLERGVLFLPDSKTGKKPLYLSAAAQSVLAAIPRIKDNPHIIAGAAKGAPRADLHRPWNAARKAAQLDGVRVHDLRHSFASFGAGAALGLPIIIHALPSITPSPREGIEGSADTRAHAEPLPLIAWADSRRDNAQIVHLSRAVHVVARRYGLLSSHARAIGELAGYPLEVA